MRKRIIAIVLVLVLIIATTACGKEEETKKPAGKPSGYRRYVCELDSSGNAVGERMLREEMEDMVSERTYIEYYAEEQQPSEIVKWYFDDSGEHLLKTVKWSFSTYYPTESYEYDWQERLIRHSQKNEGDNLDYYEGELDYLKIPSEALSYQKKTNINPRTEDSDLRVKARELITEYTYKGDSDQLATMRTVTEDGTEVFRLELGEGDIVLSAVLSGSNTSSYEETYIPEEQRSIWTYRTFAYTYDDNGIEHETPELYSGEREYDKSGRCTCSREYRVENEERELCKEVEFTYNEDGMVEVVSFFEYEGWGDTRYTRWYDPDCKMLRVEAEYIPYYEQPYICYIETYTYHSNGELATDTYCQRDYDTGEMEVDSEREYNENGELVARRDYSGKNLCYEKLMNYIKVPGVANTVRHTITRFYAAGINYSTEETYEVCTIDGSEKEWITYYNEHSYKNPDDTSSSPPDVTVTDKGVFDSDGHLLKIVSENEYRNYTYEYDSQGRLCREINIWQDDGGYEYTYEYWEGERPQ